MEVSRAVASALRIRCPASLELAVPRHRDVLKSNSKCLLEVIN